MLHNIIRDSIMAPFNFLNRFLFIEGIISALFVLLERQDGNLSEIWLILFPKRTTISK
jgi:hypothetical protein